MRQLGVLAAYGVVVDREVFGEIADVPLAIMVGQLLLGLVDNFLFLLLRHGHEQRIDGTFEGICGLLFQLRRIFIEFRLFGGLRSLALLLFFHLSLLVDDPAAPSLGDFVSQLLFERMQCRLLVVANMLMDALQPVGIVCIRLDRLLVEQIVLRAGPSNAVSANVARLENA